jgi:hypothetical protein
LSELSKSRTVSSILFVFLDLLIQDSKSYEFSFEFCENHRTPTILTSRFLRRNSLSKLGTMVMGLFLRFTKRQIYRLDMSSMIPPPVPFHHVAASRSKPLFLPTNFTKLLASLPTFQTHPSSTRLHLLGT